VEHSALTATQRPITKTIPFEPERRAMIARQLRRRGIQDARVLEAMFEVPRHEFVPEIFREAAYADRPIVIGDGQTISQPYIVAAMTEAARIAPGDKVLEIGAGSGYQSAVLAHLGAAVTTMERNPRLAEAARERLARLGYRGIQVIAGDGSEGYPPTAPYAAILVTAAAPSVPRMLFEQLADEGRLVIPVGSLCQQTLQLIWKHGNDFSVYDLDPCQFVPLIGKQAWPEKAG
jgi:protein-L-isoaspartate(D-aspartate) O-methyltransferase